MKVKQGRILLDLGRKDANLISDFSEKNIFHSGKKFSSDFNLESKVDPRPIFDKNYMSSCIRDIIFFLKRNGYSRDISPKMLLNPTSKDFFEILFFLLKKIDTNLFFGKKSEENFRWIYKTLKYPFLIPKSSRYTIGSHQIWPILLSSLKWITELLLYDCFVQKKKRISYFPESSPEETLWKQIGFAYHTFLCDFQKKKNFHDTFKSLLKYILNIEKNARQKKKKKLKNKFINFRTFFQAFILLKIFDEKEIDQKKTIRVFFSFKFSNFKNKIKSNEKESQKSKKKKKYFQTIFFLKSEKIKEKEISKIFLCEKFSQIIDWKKQTNGIRHNFFPEKIKNTLRHTKFFIFALFFFFRYEFNSKLKVFEKIFIRNDDLTFSFFRSFIFFLTKIIQKFNIFYLNLMLIKKKSTKFLKIKNWETQKREDFFEKKIIKNKIFFLNNNNNHKKRGKKKNFFFKKKSENFICNFSNKIENKNQEFHSFLFVKIKYLRVIFFQIIFKKIFILKNIDYFIKTNFLVLDKIFLKIA